MKPTTPLTPPTLVRTSRSSLLPPADVSSRSCPAQFHLRDLLPLLRLPSYRPDAHDQGAQGDLAAAWSHEAADRRHGGGHDVARGTVFALPQLSSTGTDALLPRRRTRQPRRLTSTGTKFVWHFCASGATLMYRGACRRSASSTTASSTRTKSSCSTPSTLRAASASSTLSWHGSCEWSTRNNSTRRSRLGSLLLR